MGTFLASDVDWIQLMYQLFSKNPLFLYQAKLMIFLLVLLRHSDIEMVYFLLFFRYSNDVKV